MSQQRLGSQPTFAAPLAEPDRPDSATLPASAPGLPGAPSSPRLDALLGQVIDGRYRLEDKLGAGGMGIVYRARHTVIDKRVAIKMLRSDLAADQEMTDRFLNEARAASSIGSPHIVDISDFGRLPDGTAYFVMEYLEGQSLGALISAQRVVPVPRIIHIAKQVARGLSAAHARGIFHRDLKPDNVMLVHHGEDGDFVKILDFGIAKVTSENGTLTRAGSIFGTPHYMSPEQAAGTRVDHRTDIYSLGVILYEMAAGKVPFDADNFMGILTQHMYKKPVFLRALVPAPQEIPVTLEAIVHKCLAKTAEQRYATMDALAADLERAERGVVPEAVQDMMARTDAFNVPADYFHTPLSMPGGPAMVAASPRLARRRPVLIGVLLGAVVLFSAVISVMIWSSARRPARAAQDSTTTTTATATAESAPIAKTPEKHKVVVVAIPRTAVIKQNGKPLAGTTLFLDPGETVSLTAEADGYVGKAFACDAKQDRCDVELAPATKPATTATATAITAGRPVPARPAAPPKTAPTKAPGAASAASPPGCKPGYRRGPWGDCERDIAND